MTASFSEYVRQRWRRSVSDMLSNALRSFIIARPGHELIVADFSAIEARVLAWLSGQHDLLRLFEADADVYCHQASSIYGYPVLNKKTHPDERQVGKVAILALGYAGGIGAFAQMARGYGVDMAPVYPTLWDGASPEERERAEKAYLQYVHRVPRPVGREAGVASDIVKQRWRAANPATVQYWHDLETAAVSAVQRPGSVHTVGKVRYRCIGLSDGRPFLFCQLPSGRVLSYPYPRLQWEVIHWETGTRKVVSEEEAAKYRGRKGYGVSAKVKFKGVDSVTRKWGDAVLYGGLQAENVTQAVARDLLAEAMPRAEAAGYPIVLHVHDELVAEVPEGSGDDHEFMALMSQLPKWAAGCPVAAEGFRSRRYRK